MGRGPVGIKHCLVTKLSLKLRWHHIKIFNHALASWCIKILPCISTASIILHTAHSVHHFLSKKRSPINWWLFQDNIGSSLTQKRSSVPRGTLCKSLMLLWYIHISNCSNSCILSVWVPSVLSDDKLLTMSLRIIFVFLGLSSDSGELGFALAQVQELGGKTVLRQGRTKLSWDFFPLIFVIRDKPNPCPLFGGWPRPLSGVIVQGDWVVGP